ncbi:hypothetical protein M430DRAFT_46076 [Amorphotheca resinae ATCC 22711]|uniref:Uncharacterized protein n=1 Tax=Amorphotheca resinae ATCC 22711 TaxID=857342 RepID=A0A2T3AP72_AMORE|nr:hypothetical protein M430DRAFT_46076 [Amorphotheca resinae ATCC 22711]PSS06733.1 hypothetical protein M430DRAFT_46076 [Amorphotheca resinae ATCC 22711]
MIWILERLKLMMLFTHPTLVVDTSIKPWMQRTRGSTSALGTPGTPGTPATPGTPRTPILQSSGAPGAVYRDDNDDYKGSFINAEEGHVPAAFASVGTYSVLQFSRKLA